LIRCGRRRICGKGAAPSGKLSLAEMKVTEKDVAYVADLANLELTQSERERMVRDLNSISNTSIL